MGWGGMLTFIGTSTSTWCYATARSSATSTHTWCYVGVGWGGMLTFIGTSTSTWCYATARSSATSTHTCVKKKVGCRNSVWAHTGGIDNWWKLCKDSVPNNIPSTKGSFDMSDRKIFRYVRSFQWRWENPRELLKTTAAYIKQLSWFDFGPLEEKTLRGLSMKKLNPQVRRPLFLHQNWRFAMVKPWICANYADGKNSAGMFVCKSVCVYKCICIKVLCVKPSVCKSLCV